jgi:hypothetical protein
MQILGVVASNSSVYRLAQTYTTTSTYTVPNGVYQIAGICIARGGNGSSGQSGSGNVGGRGGGGGGGGAIIGFWNYTVTPGQTWNCAINSLSSSIQANFIANTFVSSNVGADASFQTGGAGGTTTSGSAIPSNTRNFANGGTGGTGANTKTTNGPGDSGASATSGSLWVPTSFPYSTSGLPTNLYAGSGGGGGGSGARDTTGSNFISGGSGGSPNGGSGGSAFQDAFDLAGNSGSDGAGYADGAGGGGGGAYQAFIGTGGGGGSGINGGGVIYIYER